LFLTFFCLFFDFSFLGFYSFFLAIKLLLRVQAPFGSPFFHNKRPTTKAASLHESVYYQAFST